MEFYTTNVLAMSAVPAAMAGEPGLATPAAHRSGAECRNRAGLMSRVATVRNTSLGGSLTREKSVLLGVKQVWSRHRESLQFSGYAFGTPVGVDAARIDVPTGVPPRSRPV